MFFSVFQAAEMRFKTKIAPLRSL